MPFPVVTKQLHTEIQGCGTDILVCGYEDRIMVIVTQIGSFGTMLHVKKEESYGGASTFNVSTLIGRRDEPLMEACARQLGELMSGEGCTRPLLLNLGLLDHSQVTLKEIIQLVLQNRVW